MAQGRHRATVPATTAVRLSPGEHRGIVYSDMSIPGQEGVSMPHREGSTDAADGRKLRRVLGRDRDPAVHHGAGKTGDGTIVTRLLHHFTDATTHVSNLGAVFHTCPNPQAMYYYQSRQYLLRSAPDIFAPSKFPSSRPDQNE